MPTFHGRQRRVVSARDLRRAKSSIHVNLAHDAEKGAKYTQQAQSNAELVIENIFEVWNEVCVVDVAQPAGMRSNNED